MKGNANILLKLTFLYYLSNLPAATNKIADQR